MNRRSKALTGFGILFLVVGILWLVTIFIRCEGYLPKKKTTYAGIYHSAVQRVERLTLRLSPLSVNQYMPHVFILHFWMMAAWEVMCSLFYILAGISILRLYWWGDRFILSAVLMDVFLKVLIVTYQVFILSPLGAVFQKSNIMFTYFLPNKAVTSQISSYLTGIRLIQPDFLYYLLPYLVYLGVVFIFFTRSKIKEQFLPPSK